MDWVQFYSIVFLTIVFLSVLKANKDGDRDSVMNISLFMVMLAPIFMRVFEVF